MTTITIPRALLEQTLNALLLPCDRWNAAQSKIVTAAVSSALAALAAPATAPETCGHCGRRVLDAPWTVRATPEDPAWHDAPTAPGMWACLYRDEFSTAIFNDYEVENFDTEQMAECRWYGPIPQEGEKS